MSLVDIKLCNLVTKNIIKTIQMVAVKAENCIISDGEASQVIGASCLWLISFLFLSACLSFYLCLLCFVKGPATAAQKNNSDVVNLLHQFDCNLRRSLLTLNALPVECHEAVIQSLKCVAILMQNSMQPLLSSLTDAVEAILLTMHEEDFSA